MNFSWKQTARLSVNFPSGDQMRLTFGSCDNYMIGNFSAYEGERFEYLESEHGSDWSAKYAANSKIRNVATRLMQRSVFLACLELVEGKPTGSDEFSEISLPEDWQTIQGFLKNVPPRLGNDVLSACAQLNPGEFYGLGETGEKKDGVLTVTRLSD